MKSKKGPMALFVKYFPLHDESSLVQNPAVPGDRYDLPRDEFAAASERVLCRSLESAAAGNFHADDGHALDVIIPDDLCQFVRIVHCIQLRAADDRDFAAHKFLMHVGVSVSRTVGSDQQLCSVKEGSLRRNQLDLAGPLA